jgi:hypothetical protein
MIWADSNFGGVGFSSDHLSFCVSLTDYLESQLMSIAPPPLFCRQKSIDRRG